MEMIINGTCVGSELEKIAVINPATESTFGYVPKGGADEATLAVDAAASAFMKWKETTVYERAALLRKLYTLMLEEKEELGQLMTDEMGKPITEAIGEVGYAASFLDWFAEEGKRLYGRTIPAHVPNKRMQVWQQPIGVIAAITPWNFPLAMITRKVAPALAAGCTVVVKPSKESPLSALKWMELVEKAGFPPGVVNMVTGSSSAIVGTWMEDERVRKVSFTGSTEVGKMLIEQSAQQVKKLSLELGGHAPAIVCDDASIDHAVESIIAAKFRNAGQTCVCVNRIYVQDAIYDTFVSKLSTAVARLVVGDGQKDTHQIGPLINAEGLEKVESHVQDAIQKGAAVTVGGQKFSQKGYIYEPTVIRDVTEKMVVMQEETFGPVAAVQRFTSDEEVIRLANDTPFGLAAYVFTKEMARGMRLVEALDYGIVGWNDGLPSAAQAPFGGMKESGYGREGGVEGITDYVETKYVSIGLD